MTRNYRAMLLPIMLFAAVASYGEKKAPVKTSAPVKVTSVEGITEYRLANGLRVLLFPDPAKPTVTVNITYLVGSRHEGYGETGMAHLLEHLLFKGTPTHPNIPQELTAHGAPAPTAPRGSTAPTTSRRSRRPTRTSTGRSTSKPTGWSTPSSPRRTSTREMTVVRNEFEAGENDPASDPRGARRSRPPSSGTTTASPRSARGPTSRTCRSTGCRPSTGTYYQPDNAVLLVAGKFDRAKTLGADRRRRSGRSRKPTRKLLSRPTPWSRRRTASARSRLAPRRRRAGRRGRCITSRAGAHPDSAAVEVLAAHPRRHPVGPALQGAGRDEEGDARRRRSLGSLARSRVRRSSAAEVPAGAVARCRARHAVSARSTRSRRRPSPSKEEVERAQAALLKNIELAAQRAGPRRPGHDRVDRRRRLAPVLHPPRSDLRKVTPDDVQRVASRVSEAVQPHRWRVHPDAEAGPHADSADACHRCAGRGLQRRRAGRSGRGVRPVAGQHRVAHDALCAPLGTRSSPFCPRRRGANSVVANLTIRFGDEKSLMNLGDTAEAMGEMLHARYDQAHAPAD